MRKALVAIACALAATTAAAGCGSEDDPDPPRKVAMVDTAAPERDFAPLVLVDRRERWRPTNADRFLRHSVFWFAEDEGCPSNKIAVGRALKEQQNAIVSWIYVVGLGTQNRQIAYSRTSVDGRCELRTPDADWFSYQRSRPGDSAPRPRGLRRGEGFYLDLVDDKRGGDLAGAVAYVEARRATVDDLPGLRLSYWLLFGAEERGGAVHEGDWERVDVLLRRGDSDDSYGAVELVVEGPDGTRESVPWSRVERRNGHPVLRSRRGTHALAPERCADCLRWPTWRSLADAGAQEWYGYGGAWGGLDSGGGPAGALGPPGQWRPDGEPLDRPPLKLDLGAKRNVTVTIGTTGYEPANLEVPPGSTITWINRAATPQSVETWQSGRRSFDLHTLRPGASRTLTLKHPGRYDYFSSYDSSYSGTIRVSRR